MPRDAMPRREAELVNWMTENSGKLTALPARYGATPAQALIYQTAVDFYTGLYQQTVDPNTRTKAKIAAKDTARKAAIVAARQIIKVVEGYPELTDELLIELGLEPRKTPTPIPVPSTTPKIDIVSVTGNLVKLRIYDSSTPKKTKPKDARGANVYSFVGTTPPTDINLWIRQGQPTRVNFDVVFPSSVAPGTKVWFTAAWYNPRGLSGQLVAPVSTYTQFGGLSASESVEETDSVKIAA